MSLVIVERSSPGSGGWPRSSSGKSSSIVANAAASNPKAAATRTSISARRSPIVQRSGERVSRWSATVSSWASAANRRPWRVSVVRLGNEAPAAEEVDAGGHHPPGEPVERQAVGHRQPWVGSAIRCARLSAEGYGRYLVAAHDTLRYEGGEDRPLVGLTGYVAESNADTVGAFPDGQAERVDGNPKLWDDFASTERVGVPRAPAARCPTGSSWRRSGTGGSSDLRQGAGD